MSCDPGIVPMTARATLDRAMSEESLLQAITDALTLYGWRWTHSRRSDKALTMGHAGVPDVIAARDGRVLFLELKSQNGALSADQWAWLHELPNSRDCSWQVVRPADLDELLAELARP